jgi:hypothetical protein
MRKVSGNHSLFQQLDSTNTTLQDVELAEANPLSYIYESTQS